MMTVSENVIHAAALALLLGGVSAAEETAEVTFFMAEPIIQRAGLSEGPAAVLLLDEDIRNRLREAWDGKDAKTAEGRRLKMLLHEDAGEFKKAEELAELSADRLRLIWRQDRPEEARKMWNGWDAWEDDSRAPGGVGAERVDRVREARWAILPLVAMGEGTELEQFRDFLLEGLSAHEVAELFGNRKPEGNWWRDPGVRSAWLRLNADQLPGEEGDEVRIENLAINLSNGRIGWEGYQRVLDALGEGGDPVGREVLLNVLETAKPMDAGLKKVAWTAWMEAHPEEVVGAVPGWLREGRMDRIEGLGPLGMAALRSHLEERPEDHEVRFALAVALWSFGGTLNEVMGLWRPVAEALEEVPTGYLPAPRGIGPGPGTFEGEVFRFAGDEFPEQVRDEFYMKWTTGLSSAEKALTAAWLVLPERFWSVWDEASETAPEWVLRAVASKRLGALRWADAVKVQAVFEQNLKEDWARELESQLASLGLDDLPKPKREGWRQDPSMHFTGVDYSDAARLTTLYEAMVGALCWDTPFRGWSFRSSLGPRDRLGGSEGPRMLVIVGGNMAPRALNQRWRNVGAAGGPGAKVPDLEGVAADQLSESGQAMLDYLLEELTSPLNAGQTLSRVRGWWVELGDAAFGQMLYAMLEPGEERVRLVDELGFVPRAAKASSYDPRKVEWYQVPWREATNEDWAARAAKAEVFLTQNNPLLWTMSAPPGIREAVKRGVGEAFESMQDAGVQSEDLAVCAFRCSTNDERMEAAARMAATGRFDVMLAGVLIRRLRMIRDIDTIKAGLEELSHRGLALPYLDDPALIGWFGPQQVAEWTEWNIRARAGEYVDTEGERLERIVAGLSTVGDDDGSVRVVGASCVWGTGNLARLLRWLPEGRERQELAAVALTGRAVEVERLCRGLGGGLDLDDLPAGLPPADWREVARMIAAEERWGAPTRRRGALLESLIAGESDQWHLLRELNDDVLDLATQLTLAATEAKDDPKVTATLADLARGLAEEVEPGTPSRAITALLAQFPKQAGQLGDAFRRHWPEADWTSHFPARMAVAVMGEDAVLERFRTNRGDPWTLEGLLSGPVYSLLDANHAGVAWKLLEPFSDELPDATRKQPSLLHRVLPALRAGGREALVAELLKLDPQGRSDEVRISRAWLQTRQGKGGPADHLDARVIKQDDRRWLLEWAVARRDGGPMMPEGGEVEVVMAEAGVRRTLWRGAVDDAAGVTALNPGGEVGEIEVIHRDRKGYLQSWRAHHVTANLLETRMISEALEGGPIPGADAFSGEGVVAEARVLMPALHEVSLWMEQRGASAPNLQLEWLDSAGRVLGESRVIHRGVKQHWMLGRATMPKDANVADLASLRLRTPASGASKVVVSGVVFSMVEDPVTDRVISVLPFRPTCIAEGEGVLWVGGAGPDAAIHRAGRRVSWTDRRHRRTDLAHLSSVDLTTGEVGSIHHLHAVPLWIREVAGDAWFFDTNGDLWRSPEGTGFPGLVLAFDRDVELAVSPQGRWMVAGYEKQGLEVWDLEREERVAIKGEDVPRFGCHVVVEDDEGAWVVTGFTGPGRQGWRWYRLPGIEFVEARSQRSPLPVRTFDGRWCLGEGGLSLGLATSTGGSLELRDSAGEVLRAYGSPQPGCFLLTKDAKVLWADAVGRVIMASP